jgi:hypothetical protein
VYLNTRWADEHARERARIFLKNELRWARGPGGFSASPSDLDWVQTEGAALISQTRFPDAHGVALFACHGLSLREVIAVRMPFEDRLVVGVTPFLLPLAAVLEDAPAAVVVFVDAACARLVPLDATGPGEEVALEVEELSRDSHGGWAEMVESRYRGIMRQHRGRHFEAVAESLGALVGGHDVEWIVLAGEPRNLSAAGFVSVSLILMATFHLSRGGLPGQWYFAHLTPHSLTSHLERNSSRVCWLCLGSGW